LLFEYWYSVLTNRPFIIGQDGEFCLWTRSVHFSLNYSTIHQLYRGGKLYWWRKPEYPEKNTDLSKVTESETTYHIVWHTNVEIYNKYATI
jgi:hypothetical protein